jgi:hypothetical protein
MLLVEVDFGAQDPPREWMIRRAYDANNFAADDLGHPRAGVLAVERATAFDVLQFPHRTGLI